MLTHTITVTLKRVNDSKESKHKYEETNATIHKHSQHIDEKSDEKRKLPNHTRSAEYIYMYMNEPTCEIDEIANDLLHRLSPQFCTMCCENGLEAKRKTRLTNIPKMKRNEKIKESINIRDEAVREREAVFAVCMCTKCEKRMKAHQKLSAKEKLDPVALHLNTN